MAMQHRKTIRPTFNGSRPLNQLIRQFIRVVAEAGRKVFRQDQPALLNPVAQPAHDITGFDPLHDYSDDAVPMSASVTDSST